MLEPYDGKLSCTVLRRESGSNPADLAGKAIPNALKGLVIRDDDQFSLGIALLSKRSDNVACHIWVLPAEDAGEYFAVRSGNYGYTF